MNKIQESKLNSAYRKEYDLYNNMILLYQITEDRILVGIKVSGDDKMCFYGFIKINDRILIIPKNRKESNNIYNINFVLLDYKELYDKIIVDDRIEKFYLSRKTLNELIRNVNLRKKGFLEQKSFTIKELRDLSIFTEEYVDR